MIYTTKYIQADIRVYISNRNSARVLRPITNNNGVCAEIHIQRATKSILENDHKLELKATRKCFSVLLGASI